VCTLENTVLTYVLKITLVFKALAFYGAL
jgi:hypothetical protein